MLPSRRMGLEARELRKAMWLGAVLMAITASYTLVKTARDSLFLSRLPAASLPWVYIVVGVVTLAASMAIERITHDRSPLRSLLATLTGAALGLAAFTPLAGLRASWLPVGFYLYVNAYGLVLVSQFWVYANSSSDPREMKRICGIVGGAGILGGLVGGVLAAALAAHVDLRWSIAFGAGLLAICVPPLIRAAGRDERQTADPVQPAIEPPTPLLRTPYVRWLALSTLCSVIVTGLLDYQLKIAVQQTHPAAAELASFFGRFYIALNVVALLVQLFATGALLQWLGAGSAAAVLPAGLALGSGAMLLAPGFPAVLGTRLWDQIARFSVNKSAVELLFFPLRPGLKRRAKAFIGAGIERVGDALAGVLILAASLFVTDTPKTMPLLVGALVAVWLIACVRVRQGYVSELGRNLARMTLEPDREPVSLREWGILKETVRMLESPYERVALQAIDLLEQHAVPLLDARLPALMDHPSARVRARALERAIDSPAPADRQRVAALVHDRDPMVRLLALRASCAVGPGSPLAALDEYLDAENPEMRATALTYLVEHASSDASAQVRSRLERTLADGSRDDRIAVVAALGARAQPTALDGLLTPLLGDADLEVRRATLKAVGHARLVEHVPALIAALAGRETEDAAREGLIALGDRIVEPLAAVLCDATAPIEVRRVIPRVFGDLPNQSSVDALFRVRTRDDVMLSYRLLKAANRLRLANPALVFPRESIEEDLEYDVGEFLLAELHVESQVKPDGGETAQDGDAARPEAFLVLVLRERMAQAFNRVFRRLGLLYSPTEMLSAYLGTLSEYPRVRANAVEYIEGALTPKHRGLVEPLLPGAKRELRRELSATRYGLTPTSADESLTRLLEGDDLWLRTCALYVIGSRQQRSFAAQVAMNLESADSRVRETAEWATAVLAGGRS